MPSVFCKLYIKSSLIELTEKTISTMCGDVVTDTGCQQTDGGDAWCHECPVYQSETRTMEYILSPRSWSWPSSATTSATLSTSSQRPWSWDLDAEKMNEQHLYGLKHRKTKISWTELWCGEGDIKETSFNWILLPSKLNFLKLLQSCW